MCGVEESKELSLRLLKLQAGALSKTSEQFVSEIRSFDSSGKLPDEVLGDIERFLVVLECWENASRHLRSLIEIYRDQFITIEWRLRQLVIGEN